MERTTYRQPPKIDQLREFANSLRTILEISKTVKYHMLIRYVDGTVIPPLNFHKGVSGPSLCTHLLRATCRSPCRSR